MITLPIPPIRPSALAALSECARFQSDGQSRPESERGQRLDRLYREAISARFEPHSALNTKELEAVDYNALSWALEQTGSLADIDDLTAQREACRIAIPLLDHIGEVDAFSLSKRRSFDLKSGEVRDYSLQMAAYALGFMEREFLGQWETTLLFCDRQELQTHIWTLDEALCVLEPLLEVVRNPDSQPTLCRFCDWCKWKLSCPTRLKELAVIEATVDKVSTEPDRFAVVLADPKLLGRFLRGAAIMDDFRERAKEKALELLRAGERVPHCSLRTGAKNEFADVEVLIAMLKAEQKDAILKEFGTVSGPKLRRVLGDGPAEKFLSVKQAEPSVIVRK